MVVDITEQVSLRLTEVFPEPLAEEELVSIVMMLKLGYVLTNRGMAWHFLTKKLPQIDG